MSTITEDEKRKLKDITEYFLQQHLEILKERKEGDPVPLHDYRIIYNRVGRIIRSHVPLFKKVFRPFLDSINDFYQLVIAVMEAEVDEEADKKEEEEIKAFRETWDKDYTPDDCPKPCQVCKNCEECEDELRKRKLCEACKWCDDCRWIGKGIICEECEICNECEVGSERIMMCHKRGKCEKLRCKWCREYRDEEREWAKFLNSNPAAMAEFLGETEEEVRATWEKFDREDEEKE